MPVEDGVAGKIFNGRAAMLSDSIFQVESCLLVLKWSMVNSWTESAYVGRSENVMRGGTNQYERFLL
jgi:hypothetical protein